ncbi:MAG: NYN domain-containing protein [Vicinamibacterales bacterium]
MTPDDRLRIAVFIDFDNIEIGVKNTLGASFEAGLVLEALKERGDVVSKTAYSDWQRAGGYSRSLTQHAIKMVQRNLTPGGDKNGADINLALDALEMAFTHPHINAFVIVGGDSDFISLVEKLKQYDKKVFVVGGRQFTSIIMQRNCHEFIAYENLVGASTPAPTGGGRRQSGRGDVRVERAPLEQAIPLVERALQVLSEREVSPQLGLLKTTMLQLDSTFSERSYGAGSFRDFVQKLEKIGIVKIHHGKGGLLVGPAEGGAHHQADPAVGVDDAESAATAGAVPAREQSPRNGRAQAGSPAQDGEVDDEREEREGEPQAAGGRMQGGYGPPPPVTGTNAEGLREFKNILASGQIRRWPMYLRNVKQIIRQVSTSFDERTFGFANLVDLLRAAAREGFVRVDRDRQGVIRVFQGTVPLPSTPSTGPIFDIANEEQDMPSEADGNALPVTVEESVVVVDEEHGTVSEYPVIDMNPEGDGLGEDEDSGPQPGNEAVPSSGHAGPAARGGARRSRSTTGRAKEGRPAAKAPARSRAKSADTAKDRPARPRRTRR